MPPKDSDGSTKEKLQEAAKKEFMQKGFLKASLRSICKNAGVTTGALYFFFRDKEDLFDSLVRPVIEHVAQILTEHFKHEDIQLNRNANALMQTLIHDANEKDNAKGDLSTASAIYRYLYSNYDEFILAIQKSQGTKWENCIKSFVDWNFEHLKSIADYYCKTHGKEEIKPFVLRMVAHSQINCFVNIALNIPTFEEAEKHLSSMLRYLVGGWCTLFDDF